MIFIKKGLVIIGLLLLPITVSANSSWVWVTTSPINFLPFAIIITLLIEANSISIINKININKVYIVVSLANLLSFIVPYIERAYRFRPTTGGFSFISAFDKGPFYIVLLGYLLLTIMIELPTVYFLLYKEVTNKNKLIKTIVISNTITTLLVAVLERIICIGFYA